MIEETLAKIEARLQGAENIPGDKRRELQDLLATLKSEVAQLSRTHVTQAQTIARATDRSTEEATRKPLNSGALESALHGLTSSVGEFETSHPRLVQAVNSISNLLASWGI